jgi:hypothetical protein
MSRRVVLAICLLVCPFVIVESMLVWRLNATLGVCDAVVMDDECHYWNEISTYQHVGFRGGYFVDSERIAPARWTHFGPHGPGFPVLYGSLARVFGWGTATGPLFNLAALAIAILAWLILVRPSAPTLAAVLLVVASFWPIPMYLPATLQESFHYAIAFVLAGLAHRFVNGSDPDTKSFWPFLLCTVIVSFLRVTWSIVLIPVALIALSGQKRRTRVIVPVMALAAIPALVLAFQRLCSPYPNFLAAMFAITGQSRVEQLKLLAEHASFSFYALFSLQDCPLEILQRYEVIALICLSALAVLRPRGAGSGLRIALAIGAISAGLLLVHGEVVAGVLLALTAAWRGRRFDRPVVVVGTALVAGMLVFLSSEVLFSILLGPYLLAAAKLATTTILLALNREVVDFVLDGLAALLGLRDDPRPYLFTGLNLGLLLFAVVTLYDVQDWRDYRVVAPHLLLSLLVMATGSARRWAVRAALVSLLFAPLFVPQFQTSHRIRVDAKRTAEVVIDLRPYLEYEADAGTPWANSLLVPEVDLSNRVRVPPGIGVCWAVPFAGGGRLTLSPDSAYFVAIQRVGDDWLELPPKSRYVFATPGKIGFWKGCHLQLLRETSKGNLYLNMDSPPDEK